MLGEERMLKHKTEAEAKAARQRQEVSSKLALKLRQQLESAVKTTQQQHARSCVTLWQGLVTMAY